MIRNILYEIYKNFKIIFRSFSSISILILGPLALILLLGFAFSGDGTHGIIIGTYAKNMDAAVPILKDFPGIGEIKPYEDMQNCIDDMQMERTHICLEFADDFMILNNTEEPPSGSIVFFYDNTRKQISTSIVNSITKYLGIKSDEITIEGTKTIFSNIGTMVVFLSERNTDIIALVNESTSLKSSLELRKEKLIEFREGFIPRYERIKVLQSSVNNMSGNNSPERFIEQAELLKSELSLLEHDLLYKNSRKYYVYEEDGNFYITGESTYPAENNLTYDEVELNELGIRGEDIYAYNLSLERDYNEKKLDSSKLSREDYYSIRYMHHSGLVDSRISVVSFMIDNMINSYNRTYSNLEEMRAEMNDGVSQLDTISYLIDEEIAYTEDYIGKLDAGIARVEEIQKQLDSNLEKFEKLNPSLAEKLAKPILQSFQPILKNVNNIKLAFPALLAQIVLFISILFANIVTQGELNSKAYLRNLISPVNDTIYIIGLIITNLIVVMFQVLVLLLVAQFSFKIDVFSHIAEIGAVVVVLSLIFILLGMMFAFMFDNEQTSILSITFVSLAFFLFSDVIIPLEIMPPMASSIAAINPFVLSAVAFKKLLLFGLPLASSLEALKILGIYLFMSAAGMLIVAKAKNQKRL